MVRSFIIIILFLLVQSPLYGQLDLEHWFPPYYRTSPNDISEISLYLSTDKEDSFPVNIYNNNLLLATVNISKSSPAEFPITSSIGLIEAMGNTGTMKPSTRGLHLSGSKSFYASLRMAGCRSGCKSDIIASKGKSALGKEFFIVTDQIIMYGNNATGMLYQTSIMATQDNTQIKINNYNSDIVFIDGDKSDEISISLNKDQSYILVARKEDNPNPPVILDDWDPNFIGAKITSNKPIVVNNGNFLSQDLGDVSGNINMDQNVPVDKIGKEYFLVNGMTISEKGMEKSLIVATKNNTKIYFNDETVPAIILNQGEHYIGPYNKYRFLPGNQPSFTNPEPRTIPTKGMYIKSSEPIYLYQMIGGYDFFLRGPGRDFTYDGSAMTFSYPLDNEYYPKPQQKLNNIITIPSSNKIGNFNGQSKLTIKTPISAIVKVNGTAMSNPSPIVGKTGWGYYTMVPVSGDLEIQSDQSLNVDLVGGFQYTGYASSYTGFSNDPYILVNGNCIQEGVFLKLNNKDFLSFQWQLNDVDIPGATSFEYQPVSEGNYQCVVTYLGFSFTTTSVFIPNCPYNVFEVNIGNVCHTFEIDTKFTAPGHVFSKLELLTQPNNGDAEIKDKKVSVKMNDTFSGSDRLIYKLTATDGYYEVYKATFNVLPNPIADVKSELQPKSYLDETYYFDLYTAINNENNETFEFYSTLADAEKQENQLKDPLSNFSEPINEIFIRVTNQDGCYTIKSVVLVRPPVVPESVSLPNAFSPNNDGLNDVWDYSLLQAFQEVDLKIYDRYGKLVYTHSKEFFWNGKLNNILLPSDSYWVVFSYTSKGTRVSNKTMWVILKSR